MEREAVYNGAYLGVCLLGDRDNFLQREECLPMLLKLRLDPVRAENDEIALPIATNGAMLALHRVEKALAFVMNPNARNRLERTAWLNLGRNVNEPLARPLLQAPADEFPQRFLAGGEHEHVGVRRLPQLPGRSCART